VKKKLAVLSILVVFVSVLSFLIAHPHLNKTVTTSLPSGAEITLSYQTVPANAEYVEKAGTGDFLTPRRPRLQISTEIKAGEVMVPAGEYTVGVIKNSDQDFTLALIPGVLGRGDEPDLSKAIKLQSQFSSSAGAAEHMSIDISPGSGSLEGKVVLAIHYGSLLVEGALS